MISTMLGTRAIADVDDARFSEKVALAQNSKDGSLTSIGNQREFHDSFLNVVNIGARFSLGDKSPVSNSLIFFDGSALAKKFRAWKPLRRRDLIWLSSLRPC
jgi:hypothetical protein